MWYLMACRSCLTTKGHLIRIGPQARKLFCVITGLELEEDDGFPQYFCAECFVLIKKALLFRRRSRRAHFVLKEIYAVKNQVSQADVEIVNRHKTNLISPYSLWKPENTAAYSYKTEDAVDAQPEDITPDIEAAIRESLSTKIENSFEIKCDVKTKTIKIEYQQPDTVKNQSFEPIDSKIKIEEAIKAEELVKQEIKMEKSSLILVDIKPGNWRKIEKEEEERLKKERMAEIEAALQEIHGDNGYDDDMANDDYVLEDIDLEDVFKGLKEESPKESESEPEPEIEPDPVPSPPRKKKKMQLIKQPTEDDDSQKRPTFKFIYGVSALSLMEHILQNMSVRLLSSDEQRKAFNNILSTEPFSKSLYRCNICVNVFNSVELLYTHVDHHNARLKYEFGCKICSDRFETEEGLNHHSAFRHWYEYQCGWCKENHYTLNKVITCFKLSKLPNQLNKHFKIRPLAPEAIYSTMDSWTGDAKSARSSCTRCKIYFNTDKKYKVHMRRHDVPPGKYSKFYECDICSQKFISYSHLEQHMSAWHLFRYTCKECKIQFRNRQQANEHMTRGRCRLVCRVCNLTFKVPHKRIEHVYSAHRTDCGVCGYVATSPARMYAHQLNTHGYFRLNTEAELYDLQYFCEQCAIYFMDEKLLFKHLCRMKHDAAKQYENGCRSCMLLFDSAEELAAHTATTCDDVYPKQCEFCTAIVSDRDAYHTHKLVEHKHRTPETGESHLCDICGKTVKYINPHLQRHAAPVVVQIQCQYCPAKSLSYTQHVSHVIFNHTAKPYRCTMCDLRFLFRSQCREHILKTHAPVLLYACEACARRFSHLDYLHDHCWKTHGVDLKKQDKSVFLSKRMFGKIYTYPHMKIDGSLIDPKILEQTPIELCDYMDENEKLVPYSDVFFFDANVNPLKGPCKKKKKSKKRSKEEERQGYLRKRARLALKKAAALKEREAKQNEQKLTEIEENFKNEETVDVDDIVDDSLDMQEEEIEVETEDIVGELIEKDGQHFVLANGVLYTIEDNCVERLQEIDGVMQLSK